MTAQTPSVASSHRSKSSKITTSGSVNESLYLETVRAANASMTEAFAAMGLQMASGFAIWIKNAFNVPQDVIDCLNICHLFDVKNMSAFALMPASEAINTLSISALKHPQINMALLVAYAIGTLYTEKEQFGFWVSYSALTQRELAEKFQQAKFSGVITAYEREILVRLREFYGITPSASHRRDAASRSSTISSLKQPPVPAPVIVDTASASADDASEITVEAPPLAPKISQKKGGTLKPKPSFDDGHSHSSKRSLKPTLEPIRESSPFLGTLIDVTKLDHKTAKEVIGLVNLSRISPKSESQDKAEPKRLSFEEKEKERKEKLYQTLGTTPDGTPVFSTPALTPEQKQAIQYMNTIRALTPDVKEIKRSSLPASVKFSGDRTKFDEFRNAVEGHYRQQQASYLFDKEFVEMYTEFGPDCYIRFPGVTSAIQVKRDVEALYGAIQTSCYKGIAKSILLRYKDGSNGVAAWRDIVEEFGNDGDTESRLDKLEKIVNTQFTRSYKGGLEAWVRDYENAFAEMELLGENSYANDATKKRKMIQNCVAKDSKDSMMLRELCKGKSYKETCKMLRTHAIASDNSRSRGANVNLAEYVAQLVNQQMSNSQSSTDLQLQTQANLARVSPEIWKELPREIQELIMKTRLEENKKKEESSSPANKPNLPKQYSKANLTISEPNEELMEDFLNEALDAQGEVEDLELFNANLSQIVHVSISEERVISCMNSLVIEDFEKMVILDDGADTSVLGAGWEVISVHPTRKAHVVGFDHKVAVKRDLDIVSACAIVEIEGEKVLLQVNEAVMNPSSAHSLLSEYQMRDYGVIVNSIAKKHGGQQNLIMGDNKIPCGVNNCLIYFKCRAPTESELEELKPVILTQGETHWNPRADEHNAPISTGFQEELEEILRKESDLSKESSILHVKTNEAKVEISQNNDQSQE